MRLAQHTLTADRYAPIDMFCVSKPLVNAATVKTLQSAKLAIAS